LEADGYLEKRYAEFNKRNSFDAKRESKTKQEQIELAGKYAEVLQVRGPLAGRICTTSDASASRRQGELALESLRSYLATAPEGPKAQRARTAVVLYAVRTNLISEAEQAAADYGHNQPQDISERFGMETLITESFYKVADFEHMAKHARTMLKVAKHALEDKSYSAPRRDDMLVKAAALLANAYVRLNRKAAAVETFEDLRRIAISRPSGSLYRLATARSSELIRPSIRNTFSKIRSRSRKPCRNWLAHNGSTRRQRS
jgi:hypothetical protein